ncbi:RNA-binding protein 33 [Cyclopterus lumpus]|uniref:RNA-binding protein 33 n=1 Tax=Cyclopterus lumpus TaxID=8103 RepID=UPI001486AC4C|nr:RNA-binding protein 33 [Cyclopterus lumpus]
MRGTGRSKVVTSGRLTEGVKGKPCRRRVTPDPGPGCPEPAYSLYSTCTDPEEQVSSRHKGLDRCAALLTGIFQADKAGLPRAVKGGAAKSSPCSSLRKKATRTTKTDQRGRQPVQPVPGTTTLPPPEKPTSIHPPEKPTSIHPPEKPTSIPPPEKPTSIHTSIHPPEKPTSIHPPKKPTSIHPPEKPTSIHPPKKPTSIYPPEKPTSIHPPKKPTSIYPPEKPTSIYPPEKPTSIYPPEKPTSIYPPEKPTSIYPPEKPTSIYPPEKPTSIYPPEKPTSIYPPEKPTSIHPPKKPTSIYPPEKPTSIYPPEKPTSIYPPEKPTSIYPPEKPTSIHPPEKPTSIHPPRTSTFPGRAQTSISYPYCKAQCDKEFVPVRDINVQRSAVRQVCSLKMSNMQPGQVDEVPQDLHSRAETDVKGKTVQSLLGELKALIAGQGSVAERLLSHLEQMVSSTLMCRGSSNIWTEPELSLHSQNTQLCRRVRILNQQLKQKGRADTHQNPEMLVFTLQEELGAAQSRLQDLQEDHAELRKALEDREAKNALIQTDLEATRSRLLDSEREKSELASLAQQRLEDLGNLNRVLQGHDSSNRPPVVDGSDTQQHLNQHRPGLAEPPTDRITQFLMSLGPLQPPSTELVCVAAERGPASQPGVRPVDSTRPQPAHLDPSHGLQEVRSRATERRRLSRCDVDSVWSDCSTRSGSSFDTRDEVAFRDGLAALDASIASLQKTIQLDLGR